MWCSADGRNLTGEVEACAIGTGDGYALISIERIERVERVEGGAAWTLRVRLDLVDEVHDCSRILGTGAGRGWQARSTRHAAARLIHRFSSS